MFSNFFKNISIEKKGMFACALGLVLILGTLGKLQILQGILNFLMIISGLILIFWGLHATKGVKRIQEYIQAKPKK